MTGYLIGTRNATVTESIRQGYADRIPRDHQLQVFCIGNSHYWKHRHEPLDKARPQLELSGIVDVRRHCLSIVTECQYRAATSYVRNQVQELLRQVKLWVESGARSLEDEKRETIQRILNEAEMNIARVCLADQ